MRELPPPAEDDAANLQELIENPRLGAAPHLHALQASILARYQAYRARHGDPWAIPTDAAFTPSRSSFHAVYKSPPRSLTLIEELRSQNLGACPMCGAAGVGTLDHYLPKGIFPEFSFFSLNLVPACFKCNNNRNDAYIGGVIDERPIHPYFDGVGVLRLMTAEVLGPFDVPRFRAIPVAGIPANLAATVQWHITNIVERAGFAGHCRQRWSRLVKNPVLHLGSIATEADVHRSLCQLAMQDADMSESSNSWNSCFYDGLSRVPAVERYLAEELKKRL